MSTTFGHVTSSVKQASAVGEPQKAGAPESRLPALTRAVQTHKTPPPLTSNAAAKAKSPSTQVLATPQQKAAAQQVDAADLAAATALRGNIGRRKLETEEDNDRFLGALVGEQPGFKEMHVRSLIDSVTDKSKPKSLVDTSFESETPEERALLKFIFLEKAMTTPSKYGVSDSQLTELAKQRDVLYQLHGKYIEQAKLAIDVADATAPRMKIGLKQVVKAFQMLLGSDQQAGASTAEFLKIIQANNPNKDIKQVLQGLHNHWVNLAKRDRSQYSSEVSKYRQYVLMTKTNQIKYLLILTAGLDKIAAVCKRKLEEQSLGSNKRHQGSAA